MERIRAEIGGFHRKWLMLPGPAGSPLLLFLTGTGGTASWADRETGWSQIAAREQVTLVIPESLPPDPARPPSFLANPPRWNDASPRMASPLKVDDVAFLEHVIDDALARCGADAKRVYMVGFSNGAGMCFRFAAEKAHRVAAIAPVAGYCWIQQPKLTRPVPTLYTIGTRDLLVPLRGGQVKLPWGNRLIPRPPVAETLERWAEALGCSTISVTQSDDGTVRMDRYPGPVRFDVMFIDGLGHHWPGGRAQLDPRIAGPPSAAINGTEAIWEFFNSL